MLVPRTFWRTWRGGQLKLVLGSLALAVAVVTSVALLADRVEKALTDESSALLAADLVLESNSLIKPHLSAKARELGLQTSTMMTFVSMVYSDEEMHLASVRAVDSRYPLRGELSYSMLPFSSDPNEVKVAKSGPSSGETWVDARILPLLKIELGDYLEFGDIKLRVSRVLIEEPDSRGSYSFYGARILINIDDVVPAGVILAGSRVKHKLLVALASDIDPIVLSNYREWLAGSLTIHQRVVDPQMAEETIADSIDKGRRFLLLSGSVGLVLSAIALALASHKFAVDEVMQVGLYKSWGLSRGRIRRFYLGYGLLIALVGAALGICIGAVVQEVLVFLISDWLPITLPRAGPRPVLVGLGTGLLCVIGFMLPAIWHLPNLPPMTVLRKDLPVQSVGRIYRGLIGALTIALLLVWYSDNLFIAISILCGLIIVAITAAGFGLIFFRLGKWLSQFLGGAWRLALANLWRRRDQNLIQLFGFSSAIALLLTMAVVRTSLIDDWKLQLDDDTPNHFLINVAPYELSGVEAVIKKHSLDTVGWYSMVRGRLRQFNGEEITPERRETHESLRRELNLSWAQKLPAGNSIVTGRWWEASSVAFDNGTVPVSVETDLAGELGLNLGDRLTFSIGGLSFEAKIASTRSLNWDNMTPNFYFLFPEGVLENFPRTHMTSLLIPPERKLVLNDLLRNYPTVQVIELDRIIERIRKIVVQITRGIEVMTAIILACGVLVMFSAVTLSMSERLHESAILRTMGSSSRLILSVQSIEFTSLGVTAGLLAALGAEMAIGMIQRLLFDSMWVLHAWIWVAGPVAGGLVIGVLGTSFSRKSTVRAPLDLLREL